MQIVRCFFVLYSIILSIFRQTVQQKNLSIPSITNALMLILLCLIYAQVIYGNLYAFKLFVFIESLKYFFIYEKLCFSFSGRENGSFAFFA